jgi:hypothetical protein
MRSTSLSILISLGACSVPDPGKTYSVDEFRENIRSLDGQVVAVRGWLGTCQDYDCGLYPTLKEARTVEAGNSDSNAWMEAMDRRVGIGSKWMFDRTAAPLQFRLVEIKGQANAECRVPQGKFGCLDRADEITPESIKAIP